MSRCSAVRGSIEHLLRPHGCSSTSSNAGGTSLAAVLVTACLTPGPLPSNAAPSKGMLQAPLPDGGSPDNLTDVGQKAAAPAASDPPLVPTPPPREPGAASTQHGSAPVLPAAPAILQAGPVPAQGDAAPPPLAGHVPPPEPMPLPLSSGTARPCCGRLLLSWILHHWMEQVSANKSRTCVWPP